MAAPRRSDLICVRCITRRADGSNASRRCIVQRLSQSTRSPTCHWCRQVSDWRVACGPDLVEQRVRLVERQPLEVGVAPPAEIEAPPPGFRMDVHQRVKRAWRRARIVGRRHALARVAAAVVGAVVLHAKPFDATLQRGRAAHPTRHTSSRSWCRRRPAALRAHRARSLSAGPAGTTCRCATPLRPSRGCRSPRRPARRSRRRRSPGALRRTAARSPAPAPRRGRRSGG